MRAVTEKASRKSRIKPLLIFPKDGKPSLPLHVVVRMAAAKAKRIEKTRNFIQIRAIHFVDECGVYVCLYEAEPCYPSSPVLEKTKRTIGE